ncbi:hypothetical protein KEM63_11445 [Halopseudomonas nanhaiensis]|uniref:hypothetical protein n=1 Tax=Halopseudomonas nanhaiensis TaxID=2830842 RepID=UPI001CBDC3FC|nr:hypothetical protein [Halopseudomonas nanhaiensis]UAW97425.1 hypothetical protein KEM63_11445 [Halopseudomonas nanhaiensis]
MNHRLFGIAMMGKGLFAGAALAVVLQGGGLPEAAGVDQKDRATVKIERIQSLEQRSAGLSASNSHGTLISSQVATRHQPRWVF